MDSPQFETLVLTLDECVALVELNRPAKANSMSAAMWSDLDACFRWCDSESAVRVVVLAARGKHFCAGIDLQMFAALDDQQLEAARRAEQRRNTIERLQANLGAIERCRKPVLAAIQHTCIGGGVDMVSCCDMRYCTRDAYFSIKEIELGMVADVGTLQRLPRLIGDGLMRELAYTGRRMNADEAQQSGLVNRVYADREQMLGEVMTIARTIASHSPLAIRGTKEVLLYGRDHSVEEGLRYIANWNAGMLSADDLMRSVAAAGKREDLRYPD
ncbi:MAG: crotonase/enoyl-CoA hydratase family protein [Gammaproteobacteria bacterium]|nr:crotonase/enoyl-CoA hydratase family protein [Gammaproteobacteria bacterium]